jgi:signal transduction histidine kinase
MVWAMFLEVKKLTIKKQLIVTIVGIIFFAIVANSILSSLYIDSYFKDYLIEQHEEKVEKIKKEALEILMEEDITTINYEDSIENFLDNLIGEISILDYSGEVIVSVEDKMFNMHNNMMMRNITSAEEDYYDLTFEGKSMGTLIITRTGSIQKSYSVMSFKRALILATLTSGILVLISGIGVIIFISSKITKDLRATAVFSKEIQMLSDNNIKHSKIIEIRDIQISLENQVAKLKMQKKVRQERVDKLSHEARTPLTILKTHCEGALDEVVEMDSNRLESCLNEINNLSSLLANINDVVEYSNDTIKVHYEDFDLTEELKKIVKGLRLQYERKGIELNLKSDFNKKINTDRALLSQSIYNLLTNAYKFTDAGGAVSIEVKISEQNQISLFVHDNGVGIPEEDINKIFEPYFRSLNSKGIQGEGLGLYIAKTNIEALGGTLSIRSKKEKGTSCVIELPG